MFGTVTQDRIKSPQSEYEAENLILSDGFISSLGRNITYIPTTKTLLSQYAEEYGVDYDILSKVIMCESGFRHDNVFGDNGKAYGILQYHKSTFDQFCEGDYYDLNDQLKCGAIMFSQGLQYHWSCFNNERKTAS